MAKERRQRTASTEIPLRDLDALNARLHDKRGSGRALRQVMEAQIEAKAKRRRRSQSAASSGWKKA